MNKEKIKKYNIDSFGWPVNKIKNSLPLILYNEKVLFIPSILRRKMNYCFDIKKNKTLNHWYIDEILANFTFKNNVRFKFLSFPKLYFDKFLVLLYKKFIFKKIKLKKNEIILFGPYSDAYAHQLHEFIIRLFHIKNNKLKKNKIIIDYNLKKILNSEVFKFIFKNLNISFYKSDQIILFENVNYLSHIENRFVNKIFVKNIKLIRKECNNFFKKKNYYNPIDYVLASRKKAKKRHLINEDLLLEKLSKYGFKRIYFEDLSHDEQINLSLNMKILVGYHGTAFTNAGLFMNKSTHILEIMHEKYPQGHGKLFCDIQGSINKRFFCNKNYKNLDGECNIDEIISYIKKII
jgi:hypothetical protein